MSTNVKKEITLVTDIVSFAVNHKAVNVTTSNSNIDQYFKIQAWENAIASPACKSWSYLANTVTQEGVPVLVMLSPKNSAAVNVFRRLYDELAEMIIVNVPLMTFTLETDVTCYNPAVILSQLPPYKPDFVTYTEALASLVLKANIPGAFYIETITDGAYLHLPNHQKVEEWFNGNDELVVECYSARNLKNHQSSKILLSSKNVRAVSYVPEKQLLFLRNTPELFDHVGKDGIDLPTLYCERYLDVKIPDFIRKRKGEMVHVPVEHPKHSEPMQRYYGPNPMVGDPVPGLHPYFNSQGPVAHYENPQKAWPHDRIVTVWNAKTNSQVELRVPKGISVVEHLKNCSDLSAVSQDLSNFNVIYTTPC